MTRETIYTADNFGKDPLAMARTYHHGLRTGLWTSIGGALAVFQQSGLRIFKTPLQNAVRVAALPSQVLALFDKIPLTNAGAETLLKVVKRDGIALLTEHCATIDRENFASDAMLLAEIRSEGSKPVTNTTQTQEMHQEEVKPLPIELAKRYTQGVEAGKWTTQTEASRLIGCTKADLKRAVQLSRLPSEVLALFNKDALNFYVGRELLSLKGALGPDNLVELSSAILNNGALPPAGDVLRSLRGRAARMSVERRNPLQTANEYATGKADGRWGSPSTAERILRLPKGTVGAAIRIAGLTPFVLELFPGDELSFFVGRKLLSIQTKVGREVFLANAKAVYVMRPRPFKKAMFASLDSSKRVGGTVVELRIISTGGVSHIRVTSPRIKVLGKYIEKIQEYCDFLMDKDAGMLPPVFPRRDFK